MDYGKKKGKERGKWMRIECKKEAKGTMIFNAFFQHLSLSLSLWKCEIIISYVFLLHANPFPFNFLYQKITHTHTQLSYSLYLKNKKCHRHPTWTHSLLSTSFPTSFPFPLSLTRHLIIRPSLYILPYLSPPSILFYIILRK